MSNVKYHKINRLLSYFGLIAISRKDYEVLLMQYETYNSLNCNSINNLNSELDECGVFPTDDYDDHYIDVNEKNY
jgi:hypothetical protein